MPARPSGLGRRFLDFGDGILDEEDLGIEGEGYSALLVGVVPPRDLQRPLDAFGLHHHPETDRAALNLHRDPYHLPTSPLAEIAPTTSALLHVSFTV